eukprot:GFYU01000760.1.p1 GENE.GFYU01000760.1~~GFYU01000760.1.p1  ORF type:complete len:469 (-),score=128.21 GFYU01000760.1:72-1478(-)
MISALLFVNQKGEVVISRTYRDDVNKSVIEAYRHHYIAAKEANSPVKRMGESSFMHIRHNNMFVVAITNINCNAMSVFQYLHTLVSIFKAYFGRFDEEAIRNNFVIMYELLDETVDFGYPQITGVDILKQYITQQSIKSEVKKEVTLQATGATPWRNDKVKYRKNEVFIDVIEYVNLLMSPKGTPLRVDVSGSIIMKTFLSGQPECKFGMNDKVVMDKEVKAPGPTAGTRRPGAGIEIDDCVFHQCVRLGKFDADRTISFVPPDGEFELMRYRCTENVNLPFRVTPLVKEVGRTRLQAAVNVRAMFTSKLFATNVIVKVPMPKNTARAIINTTAGRAKYAPDQNAIVWKMRKFPGEQEYSITAEVDLIATTADYKAWSRPPVSMEFQVPMFTASGLHVRFLKVFEKSNYQTIKWVRYITKAGSYQNRISGSANEEGGEWRKEITEGPPAFEGGGGGSGAGGSQPYSSY